MPAAQKKLETSEKSVLCKGYTMNFAGTMAHFAERSALQLNENE